MILCDVSVVVAAGMPEAPHHSVCREAIRSALAGPDGCAVSELILAAVVRISTNPRVWKTPATVVSAFAFVNALRTHQRATLIAPGPRHFRIFEDLVTGAGIRGADTTDAYLAALAQEHASEFWTTDKGFARFSGLRWRNLLA